MSLSIVDLSVNYLKEYIGIDSLPRFSWKLASEQRGECQTAYRIVVAASQTAAEQLEGCWDSGWRTSADSLHIPYAGGKLSPLTRYQWQVFARDSAGAESVSDPSFFETGKLDAPWNAYWISADFIDKAPKSAEKEIDALAAPYLRKTFAIENPIASARLVLCGLGYFQAWLNGQQVGDDYLSTPWTQYDITSLYRVYDVTALLTVGQNAIGVILGNGFYNCFTDDPWNTSHAPWRHWPKLMAELHLTYGDGTTGLIATDRSWKSDRGPIYFNGIRHGEHYDARLEQPGWNEPHFDDTAWKPARLMRGPGGILKAMEMEPIRVHHTFPAVSKWKTPEGWVFDVGQNLAGIGSFAFHGKAGTEITIRYSDLLTPERSLTHVQLDVFIKNYCFQTDKYIKKTDGEERWHPIFTYHGFQYIEISGIDYEPELSDVTALAFANEIEAKSRFFCSEELLNRVQHMCWWSSISCVMGVFSADTHREKSAWTGDGSLSSEQLLINFGPQAFLTKWLGDIRRSQRPTGNIPCIAPTAGWGYNDLNGPDWSSAIVDIPWNIYLSGADTHVLAENYEAITRHFSFMESMAVGNLLNYGLGDWCAPFEGAAVTVNMSSFKCPVTVTDTAYFYSAARRLAQMAEILGKRRDTAHYAKRAREIKKAFRKSFFDKEQSLVKGDCQTATGVMIYHGLAEPEELSGLFDRLQQQIEVTGGHLDFGVLGNKAVMHALGHAGLGHVGIEMLRQPDFPSVRRWVELGANTLWECWNGGGSHNHHMFSDLSAFFYKYVAGVAADENQPGYAHILLRPALAGGLDSAGCEIASIRGPIRCEWTKNGGHFSLQLQIPVGSHATLYLPPEFVSDLSESGKPAEKSVGVDVLHKDGQTVIELTSGSYAFEGAVSANL